MKNPTTTMFLHQNVILNNKPYTYNQATGTYQEANIRLQFQQVPKFQQAFYVQHLHLNKDVTIDNKPYTYNPKQGVYQQTYGQPQSVFRVQPQPFYNKSQQQVFYNHLPKFVAQPLQSKQEPNYQLQKNNHTNGNMLDMFESVESVVCSLYSSTCSIDDITRDNWSKKITISNNNILLPENNFTKVCESPYDQSNSSEANNLKSRSTSPGSVVSNPFVISGLPQKQL